MAELTVNISGTEQYTLQLSIYDSDQDQTVDVWKGIFTDTKTGDSYEVYFEAEADGLEIWDIIDLAIEVYRDSIEEEARDV